MPNLEKKLLFTFGGLISNVWIFSILVILAEKNLLEKLCHPVELDELKAILGLNESVLDNMLAVLVEQGAMIKEGDVVYFSEEMQALIKLKGAYNIQLVLKRTQDHSKAWVKDICDHHWQQGWYYQDESLLQTQGDISQVIVTEIFALTPELDHKLNLPSCTLVDVGAGVAKISLKACELYPELKVVAIEPADIPYKLAQQNIAHSNYTNRIELRKIMVQNLKEKNTFDVIWFPQWFLIEDDDYHAAIHTIYSALKPGGVLVSLTVSEEFTQLTLHNFVFSLFGIYRSSAFLVKNFTDIGFREITALPAKKSLIAIVAHKPNCA